MTRGEGSLSSLKDASKEMAESMSEDQLEEFAGTKRKIGCRQSARTLRVKSEVSIPELERWREPSLAPDDRNKATNHGNENPGWHPGRRSPKSNQ